MTSVWKPRPLSFPSDEKIPFAAEVNEFHDIPNIRTISDFNRKQSKDSIDINLNSNLFKARDSVFVRQKQRNSVVSVNYTDDGNQSDSESVKNNKFTSIMLANEGIDNEVFEGDDEVVLRNSLNNHKTGHEFENEFNFKDIDLDEDLLNKENIEEEVKPWDTFITLPPPDDDETLDGAWTEFFIKCLKVFAYFFTFVVILGSAVISKSLILLMASMIRVNRMIPICNEDIYDIKPALDIENRYAAVYEDNSPQRIAWIWCLFFAVIAPDVFAFGRSLRICYFKAFTIPSFTTFLTVLLMETLSSIGISLLVFLILPTIDVIKGSMMTNALCLIPGLLLLLKSKETNKVQKLEPNQSNADIQKKDLNQRMLTIGAIICQIIALIIWPVIAYYDESNTYWFIPLALILISMNWWENFLSESSNNIVIQNLIAVKKDLTKSRYFTYMFVSIWKMIVIFGLMLLILFLNDGSSAVKSTFTQFVDSFNSETIRIIRDKSHLETSQPTDGEMYSMTISDPLIPVWILLIQISVSYMCYAFAKFTCKIHIQTFSFAIPVNLAVPVTVSFLWAMAGASAEDKCGITQFFNGFQYIYWFTDDSWKETDTYYKNWNYYVSTLMWITTLASQILIAIHTWTATSARLASTEELFINPMYSSVVIDQSLAFNRRRFNLRDELQRNDEENNKKASEESDNYYELVNDTIAGQPVGIEDSDEMIRIYVCATMWHENKEEMIQMLKAVMRLDEDQCSRKIAQTYFELSPNITEYYEIEFNIFFDDAFDQGASDKEDDRVINRFVKQLIETMDEAASNVHGVNVTLKKPNVVPTPYGGKLEWTLPGQNKLIAHLKDKILIRHRKRWSQCMYMYYLLGLRLADLPMDIIRKETRAMNTFILALDGDINFRPHALHLVVDLMKKNKRLGAACGRIHPIGGGPMVWYQKFEYAIGHWLQKATEHVFGCVLCSPGCFSLFRAKAVMDHSVMNKYTTKPTEAIHYVQYDQGEDRWLCTLLLQQGWRIEYCAASDSYTHAPEGFGEFYTQRRRWAPSTMANILDLLSNYKRTVKQNTDISNLYILYQAMLMLGTILSPGTIFLMVVGAMQTVMGFETKICLAANIVPILLFTIICLVVKKNDHIIFVAMILSTIYALLMLAVLVGTAISISQDGFLAPNSMFFVMLMGSFIVAAIIHPQEFACVLPLLLYMLLIPSMYLLLTIYSVTNMHIVTWGTREVKSKLTAKELKAQAEAQRLAEEAQKQKKNKKSFANYFHSDSKTGLFTCMCCSGTKSEEGTIKLNDIWDQLTKMNDNMNYMKTNMESKVRRNSSFRRSLAPHNDPFPPTVPEDTEDEDIESICETTSLLQENQKPRLSIDDSNQSSTHPIWTRDKLLTRFPITQLSERELQFWNDFIPKYLLPLDENPKEQERISNELKELRNKAVFAFGIMNTIFILFVYLLQMHKDVFGIQLPAGIDYYNRTYDEVNDKWDNVPIYKHVIMDPIGLVLVLFFGAILIVQLIGMFMHRFGTLAHLLAFTSIDFFTPATNNTEEKFKEDLNKSAVQFTKSVQKQGVNDMNERLIKDETKRNTLHNRRQSVFARPQTLQPLNLNEAFRNRVLSITPETEDIPNLQGLRRKSVGQVLINRRKTVDWGKICAPPTSILSRGNRSIQSSISSSVITNPRPKSLVFKFDHLSGQSSSAGLEGVAVIGSPRGAEGRGISGLRQSYHPTLKSIISEDPNLSPTNEGPPTGQHSIFHMNVIPDNVAKDLSSNIIRNSISEINSFNPNPNETNTEIESPNTNGQQVSAQIHSTDSSSSSSKRSSNSSRVSFNFDTIEESDNSSVTTNESNFPVTTFQPKAIPIGQPSGAFPMTTMSGESGEPNEECSTRL